MTNNEAIGILGLVVETAKGRCFVTDEAISDAYEMAINALKAQEQLANDSPELDSDSGGLISRQAAIKAVNTALFPKVNTAKDAEKALRALPSAQPEKRTEKRTETHACDCIDRQAALDWLKNEWNGMVMSLFDGIKGLPSAQPELPDWAQKVEEYRKCAPSFVRNPLVWALYKTWKEYDERLFNHSRAERRTDG